MVDIFALSLCHGLLVIALLRLVRRPDLDSEEGGEDTVASPPRPGLQVHQRD
ncbi:MAG: hypothetical protein KGM49_09865 [Sphingomonadales bacterium]|nr:hypothetical protein [Sphingomonadales bacterium]